MKFLTDHNYNFESCEMDEEDMERMMDDENSFSGKLKKREIKSNQKIAAAIEKLKRNFRHKTFFENMASNPRETI